MRFSATVTSLSWIPVEAITGVMKLPMTLGISHYDDPPPEVIDDLEALRQADKFRFANELTGWIEVEDGAIVEAGYAGGGHVGATTLRLARKSLTVPAVSLPDLRSEPEITDDKTSVRLVQTAGGRTGAPMPRTVHRPPFIQISSPIAWTTLALTLRADGTADFELIGASPFPRHWIHGPDGRVVQESGLVNYTTWSKEDWGDHTPWGHFENEAIVSEVESTLERHLGAHILKEGEKPKIHRLKEGQLLIKQGDPGEEVFVLLDGILTVVRDGVPIAEVGPGAILGEMAVVSDGRRTASLRAATPAK
ncbi:MAG: cyclic nucleotide-binding domain-containing protein, partial [Acidimicrobiia bacterium]|nr:cyclic nucleotide-binding domain-containing protein [Acidimicrobiia bacterium]